MPLARFGSMRAGNSPALCRHAALVPVEPLSRAEVEVWWTGLIESRVTLEGWPRSGKRVVPTCLVKPERRRRDRRGVARTTGASVLLAASLFACGSSPQDEGPVVNWDKPFGAGPVVPDVASAVKVGHLPFRPVVPHFDQAPTRLQVTSRPDPPTLAVVYRFRLGVDFTTDGRVSLTESAAEMSNDTVLAAVDNPPGPPDDFTVVDLGRSQKALLIHAHGLGRVRFVRDAVLYDIAGPGLTPQEAQVLGRQLVEDTA